MLNRRKPSTSLIQPLGHLRFDRVLDGRGTALLRDLVIARVMAPGSKRASAEQLDLHCGRTHSLDSVYRLMDALHARLDVLKQIVLAANASLTRGSVQMMLFDVSTLYCERVHADEPRPDALDHRLAPP